MSSITLDRPETRPQDADEVAEFREHDTDWTSQQRDSDRPGLNTEVDDRAEHAERDYDQGDAPPGDEADGTVDDEFANPT